MMRELKECPFCGWKDEILITADMYRRKFRVECENCGCAGPEGITRKEAMRLWDTRETENEAG